MSDTGKIIRDVAKETRPIIEQMMEGAEVLARLGRVCRDNDIDWSQLKALIKAQIRDEQDEEGKGEYVAAIINRADAAQAYVDILSGQKSFSDEQSSHQKNKTDAQSPTAPAPAEQLAPKNEQWAAIHKEMAPDEFRAAAAVEVQHLDLTERDGIPAFLDRRVG